MTTQHNVPNLPTVCESLVEVELFVAHWFGEPCEDYDPECIVCQHWDAVRKLQRAYMDSLHAADH